MAYRSEPVTLTLPQPPEANHYWRCDRGTVHLTPAARAYRDTVFALARQQHPLVGSQFSSHPERQVLGYPFFATGDVIAYVAWFRSRKSGDLDNRLKPLLDALQGTAYTNDRQVAALVAWRVEDAHQSRVEVRIEPWEDRGFRSVKEVFPLTSMADAP